MSKLDLLILINIDRYIKLDETTNLTESAVMSSGDDTFCKDNH